MFLAIINDTYSEVKADLSTQESEFDLGAFLKKGSWLILEYFSVPRAGVTSGIIENLKDIPIC